MKQFFKFALVCAMAVTAGFTVTSCKDDEEKPDDNGQITLPNANDGNQTVYADDQEKGVTFTAKSAWMASVAPATRASNVSWLRLLVNGTEKYEGAAGTFELTIETDLNTSGSDRKATITLTSGTDEVEITVTQKGVKEDNTPLTDADLLLAHAWKHVSFTTAVEGEEPEVLSGVYTLTFNADGSVAAVGADQDEFTDFFGLDPLPTYSLAGDKLTFHITSEGAIFAEESGAAVDMELDIVKLIDSELEFMAAGTQKEVVDSIGTVVEKPLTVTWKYQK